MSHRQSRVIVAVLVAFAAAQVLLFVLFENGAASDTALRHAELGQCYRVNVLRYQLNQGSLLHLHRLLPYLPPTDCEEAVAHPETYIPPRPIFVSPRRLRRLLKHPPQPPSNIDGDTDYDRNPDHDHDIDPGGKP